AANPAKLSEEELGIVLSWRHLVTGRFIALRQLKKHMVLLACDAKSTAYGVTGLVDPMERVIRNPLPAMIETVLLPFRGKIVYDGIVSTFNVTFGPGSRRGFEEDLRIAKATNGIITSLPWEAPASNPSVGAGKPRPIRATQPRVASVHEVLKQVVAMTDAFCQTRLNKEYTELCRKLAEKLAAKRPSPLLRGELRTWACGIIRTIGWVNFLDDRSQSPHMKLPVIDQALGVAESTGQGKAKAIRQLLKIHQFDHRWTLPSRWESNPMIWTLQDSNGFMIDIRQQPVAMQRSAFKQGLIPYVPADRAAAAVQERISNSTSRRLFQFKITLRGVEPVIWRRIQVFDDTLDKLHDHIQAAMGWTNSHLHHFFIEGRRCGDPELLDDDIEPFSGLDSTKTLVSALLPGDSAPVSFEYHYDFGDSWVHDVHFEGSPPPQPGVAYPQCLEGERACPPEDVGGIGGYAEYLEAMADPSHERHQEMLDWNGPFNPDGFSPRLATHVMQEGIPDWRKMV
ncbi:MAG: plasmid pRiA4b ORF-3 family protein, partial [Verrucomicrobia bacterium]|nr:plasmid pRiA4b ORF-3 family protein [Verrucomicrobiota bacterium]